MVPWLRVKLLKLEKEEWRGGEAAHGFTWPPDHCRLCLRREHLILAQPSIKGELVALVWMRVGHVLVFHTTPTAQPEVAVQATG